MGQQNVTPFTTIYLYQLQQIHMVYFCNGLHSLIRNLLRIYLLLWNHNNLELILLFFYLVYQVKHKILWSPKRKSKLFGLDVEAEERYDEVQKRSRGLLDWTLKRREGTMKSKKEVEAWKNRKFKKVEKS